MAYQMKDLGYIRTATAAKLRVEMPDGSLWDVPVQVVADSRDENYSDEKEDTIGFIRAKKLDSGEIYDWAANNMNWSEVSAWAQKVDAPRPPVDWQDGWINGAKKIIGRI